MTNIFPKVDVSCREFGVSQRQYRRFVLTAPWSRNFPWKDDAPHATGHHHGKSRAQAFKEAGARCRCRIAGAGLLARSPWARSRALCRSTMRQSNTTRQDWWMMQRTSFARPSSATNATSLPLYPSQSLSPCSATLFTGQQSRTCHNKVCRSWLARSCFCYARLCIVSHVGEYDADTLNSGSGVLAARKRRY